LSEPTLLLTCFQRGENKRRVIRLFFIRNISFSAHSCALSVYAIIYFCCFIFRF